MHKPRRGPTRVPASRADAEVDALTKRGGNSTVGAGTGTIASVAEALVEAEQTITKVGR